MSTFVPTKVNVIPHLLPNQMKQADGARNTWRVQLESEMTAEHFLKAEAYAHVAKMLGRGDRIEVLAADSSWYAEFIVRSVEGLNVQIGPLMLQTWGSKELLEYEDYAIDFNERVGARVIRKSDNRVMVEGLQSLQSADNWLRTRCGMDPESVAA
jgi:hypothetical protein